MTITITHVKQRGLLIGALVLGSLFFTNCSSDDDSPEPPAPPVVEEFEEVKDLDPVVDPEPEVTEPETGEVGQSAETNSMVADILGANEAGEVDASTEADLAKVEEAAAEMPAEVTEVAQALDEAAVDILLDEEQDLEGSLADLQTQIRELPEEVLALLPAISFPVEVDGVSATAAYKTGTAGLPEILDAIAQVEGSCFELNREAYDDVIEDLSAQRDENLSVVNANYTRRLQEAESRYTARLAQHETNYAANKEELKLVIMSLLQAAEVLKFLGLTQMEQQTRLLALFYTIEAKTALAEWDAAVRVLLLQYQDAEIETALTLKDTKTAEVVAAFEASKAQAKGLLDAALAKCHDQGLGN